MKHVLPDQTVFVVVQKLEQQIARVTYGLEIVCWTAHNLTNNACNRL
jgi:hypothetical protein